MIFVGRGAPDVAELARSLSADRFLPCPSPPPAEGWRWDWADELTGWRREIEVAARADRIVVCTWGPPGPAMPVVELDAGRWRRHVEWPTALWFAALVAAAASCEDGGSVVAVVERPATIDAPGHGAAVTVAEGVINLVRSLAAAEGARSVRVNAVVTARSTDGDRLPGAPPPLATFPGRVEVEVAGAVRLLLSDDAAGLTGTALHATCGRR